MGEPKSSISFLESQDGRVNLDNIRNHPGLPSELYLRHSCTPESDRGVGTWRGCPAYLRVNRGVRLVVESLATLST